MTICHLVPSAKDIEALDASEAGEILLDLRMLRDHIVTAWRERAVILSPDEQAQLHAEIKQICEFLTDLTHDS